MTLNLSNTVKDEQLKQKYCKTENDAISIGYVTMRKNYGKRLCTSLISSCFRLYGRFVIVFRFAFVFVAGIYWCVANHFYYILEK